MKTRLGYVSNSSSSSFVMVQEKAVKAMHARKEPLDLNYLAEMFKREIERKDELNEGKWIGLFDDGVKEFGWDVKNYYDEQTKWNWMVLQAYYGGTEWTQFSTDEYRKKLEDYLEYLVGREIHIDWDGIAKLDSDCDAYIDHQSIDSEETFDTVDRLGISEFLLSQDAFVHTDNDNH